MQAGTLIELRRLAGVPGTLRRAPSDEWFRRWLREENVQRARGSHIHGHAAALAEAEAAARSLAAAVETAQVSGEPGPAVCELARSAGVDLIAIRAGGRDQPRVGPKSLGPTARFVSDHSPCHVLLLRGGR